MSSYLNFYVIPKKTKKKYSFDADKQEEIKKEEKITEGLPLLLISFSRACDVYQAYNETLNPAYCGVEEKFTEISYEDAKRVVDDFERDLKKSEERLKVNYKILKEGGFNDDIWQEIQTSEEYLKTQKETLSELIFISNIVYEISNGYTDFEKILINVG